MRPTVPLAAIALTLAALCSACGGGSHQATPTTTTTTTTTITTTTTTIAPGNTRTSRLEAVAT